MLGNATVAPTFLPSKPHQHSSQSHGKVQLTLGHTQLAIHGKVVLQVPHGRILQADANVPVTVSPAETHEPHRRPDSLLLDLPP